MEVRWWVRKKKKTKKQKWIYDLCFTACKAFLLDLRPPSAVFGARGGAQLAISCSGYRVTVGSDTSFASELFTLDFPFSPIVGAGGGFFTRFLLCPCQRLPHAIVVGFFFFLECRKQPFRAARQPPTK